VIGIGAAAAFVEPLAAAGPATVAFQCKWLARTLVDCDGLIRPSLLKQFNKQWQRLVDSERDFLGLFYRFNQRLNTPFWQEARQNAYVGELDIVLRSYQDIGPSSLHRSLLLYEQDPIGLEGYFSVLVGQRVPWSTPWRPSADELANWANIANNWRRSAAAGFTVNQSSELLLGRAPVVRQQPQMRLLQTVA
jgi:tryptophan halogenase